MGRGAPGAGWRAALLALAGAFVTAPALAARIEVGEGVGLSAALAAAAPGDEILLAPGVYAGPVRITRPVALRGAPGAIIDGQGRGRTVDVMVAGVALRGLTIRNSGRSAETMDAGVFLEAEAAGAIVEGNSITDCLVGVYVHGAPDTTVRGNRIRGWTAPNLNDSGNGVYVWNAPGAQVIGNDISGGRDGIFSNASRHDIFRDNRLHGVRFAVHYMYTNDSEVSGNVSTGNHAGYVIMFSDHIAIRDNRSDGDRDHGFLFNYANGSEITGNAVIHGGEKCVFIYNANKNRIVGNAFEGCQIGIHFTAGSERNVIAGNAFIGNRTQVMYVGTRNLEWSWQGRGNFWSDNPAFDLDGDGIADSAYRPNDLTDQVVWRYPLAKLLLNSPAVQLLRWAQAQFPNLHPGGVIDSAPLMRPPPVAALQRLEGADR